MTPHETLLADALEDCLARITAGEAPEHALSRYPELEAELKPALVAALTVRHRRPDLSSAFTQRLEAELDAAMAALYPPAPRAVAWWPFRLSRPATLRLAASLAALVVAFTSLSVVSANSRPGDLLYPVHTVIMRMGEASRSFFTTPWAVRGSDGAATASAQRVHVGTTTAVAPATVVTRRGVDQVSGPVHESALARAAAVRVASAAQPGTPTVTLDVLVSASPTPTLRPTRTPGRPPATATDALSLPTTAPLATIAPPQPTDEPRPTKPPRPDPQPGAITGRITDQDGHPVAGARVSAVPEGPRGGGQRPGQGPGPGPGGVDVTTGADGTYRIDGLRPNRYRVKAEDPAHRGLPHWFRNAIDPRDAEPVVVGPGATVAGIDISLDRGPGPPHHNDHGDPPSPPAPTASPMPPTATAAPDVPTATLAPEQPTATATE
jgi:hypothetical protein